MRHKRACHVCPQVYPACYQVLPCRTCGYPSWTLYALVIILSFQVLFPRLLRKCGVAVSARLVCRKTRQAVSRVLSGMAGICLSGIFTVFFFFFLCGASCPFISWARSRSSSVPDFFSFRLSCSFCHHHSRPVLSLSCSMAMAPQGGGFPLVVWRCKRRRKEGLICLGTEKKKKQKKVTFFEKKLE